MPARRVGLLVVVVCLLWPSIAAAEMYSFYNITANSTTDAEDGESQLSVEVTEESATEVRFTFLNVGAVAMSITDIYFDDGTLLGIASIENSSGVSFGEGASPRNLPGGETLTPPFEVTAGFLADSDPAVQPNGVNPGESVSIIFELINSTNFADLIDAIAIAGADGGLRIGIHVQGFSNEGSESFVNNDFPDPDPGPLVPEPSSLALGCIGLALAGAFARRRGLKRPRA